MPGHPLAAGDLWGFPLTEYGTRVEDPPKRCTRMQVNLCRSQLLAATCAAGRHPLFVHPEIPRRQTDSTPPQPSSEKLLECVAKRGWNALSHLFRRPEIIFGKGRCLWCRGKRNRLPSPPRCGSGRYCSMQAPRRSFQGSFQHFHRVYRPVVNRAESHDQPSVIRGECGYILPYGAEILDERILASMRELRTDIVRRLRRSSEKPLTKPLIGLVGPKSIVGRRRNDPRWSMSLASVADNFRLAAVALPRDRVSSRRRMRKISPGTLRNDVHDIHSGRFKSTGTPESNRVSRFRRIGARGLIGKIRTGAIAPEWSMQGPQEKSPQCSLLGRKLYAEESFAKSAKRIENFPPIGKRPELALGQFPGRGSIQHFPCHMNNLVDASVQRYQLRLRSGCCDGIGIDPDGGQPQQPCGEISRSPATERIEYPIV